MSDVSTMQHDHDLLIELNTKVDSLINSWNSVQIPTVLATHEQKIVSIEARLKGAEARFWWLMSVPIMAIVAGAIGLLFKH